MGLSLRKDPNDLGARLLVITLSAEDLSCDDGKGWGTALLLKDYSRSKNNVFKGLKLTLDGVLVDAF